MRRTLTAICIAGLAGCAMSGTVILRQPQLEPPLVERRPATIGLYIAPAFESKVHTQSFSTWNAWTFQAGAGSVSILKYCLGGLFEHVRLLDKPLALDADGLDGVIVARAIHMAADRHVDTQVNVLRVSFYLELQSGAGAPLGEWELWASGTRDPDPRAAVGSFEERWVRAAESALRALASKCLVELPLQPAVQSWRSRNGVKAPLPEQMVVHTARTALLLPGATVDRTKYCLEDALRAQHPRVAMASLARARNAVFPWLEPDLLLQHDDQVIELLRRPAVAARLANIGVKYVVMHKLVTISGPMDGPFQCGYGFGAAGCFGVAESKSESSITVRILDIGTGKFLGEPIAESATGVSRAAAFLFPIWSSAKTDEQACAQAARRLAEALER